MNTKTIARIGMGIGILAIAGTILYLSSLRLDKVYSFEDCVNAGYPVTESYPLQCRAPDGRTFTQDIGNELEKLKFIQAAHPRPNEEIENPLTVEGKARGNWYFEASFPIILLDAHNRQIGQAAAQAQGEWMTLEFVPFHAQLHFTPPSTATGTLLLKKDNPSGLAQHEDELRIPVVFKLFSQRN